MKKITRWSPDTCDCVVEYEWDTDDAPETRTHTVKSVVECKAHAGTPEIEIFAQVQEENQNKNKALNKIMEDADLAEDVEVNGETQRQFKKGMEVGWSFDEERKLTFSNIPTDKKAALMKEVEKVVDKTKLSK